MPGDLLEDLKSNRQRAIVPEREDPLIQKFQFPLEESEQTSNLSKLEDLPETSTSQADSQEELLNLDGDKIDNYPSKLRRLTIRIDESVCLRLDALCSRQNITPETLVEALFSSSETNSSWEKRAIKDAKERYRKRKLAGVKKRASSMQQKYCD